MCKMLAEVLSLKNDVALLLTEFGADSLPGFHARGRDLWSEEYHADLIREVIELAREYTQIIGTFPFCFSDYRDPSKLHNGYWNELNLKGIVDYHRQPKLAFAALREAYRK
jgi:beta-glucuronidase